VTSSKKTQTELSGFSLHRHSEAAITRELVVSLPIAWARHNLE